MTAVILGLVSGREKREEPCFVSLGMHENSPLDWQAIMWSPKWCAVVVVFILYEDLFLISSG